MTLAETAVTTGWLEYGPLGLIVLLLASWITLMGRWIAVKFLGALDKSNSVVEKNSEAHQRNADAFDSWTRESGELTKALDRFNSNADQCRKGMQEALEMIARGETR